MTAIKGRSRDRQLCMTTAAADGAMFQNAVNDELDPNLFSPSQICKSVSGSGSSFTLLQTVFSTIAIPLLTSLLEVQQPFISRLA